MADPDPAKYTQHFNLYKPDNGESGWGPTTNKNWDDIDALLAGHDALLTGMNIEKLGGNPIALNKGIANAGTLRVAIVDDDTLLSAIRTNTKDAADRLQTLSVALGDVLEVKILDEAGYQVGTNTRPLIVKSAIDGANKPVPLNVVLSNSLGDIVDIGAGASPDKSLRVTIATNDQTAKNFGLFYGRYVKAGTLITPLNGAEVVLNNTLLRDTAGAALGNAANPIAVTIAQDGAVSKLAFGAGNKNANTLRMTLATDDTCLGAVLTRLDNLGNLIDCVKSPSVSATKSLQVGLATDNGIVPAAGNSSGSIHAYLTGGTANIILKNASNQDFGTQSNPLYVAMAQTFPNAVRIVNNSGVDLGTQITPIYVSPADGVDDRGSKEEKPYYVTVVSDPSATGGMNLSRIAGNTVTVGKGTAGNGTQRVVIANDDQNLQQANTSLTALLTKMDQLLLLEQDLVTNRNKMPLREWLVLYAQGTGAGYLFDWAGDFYLTRRLQPANVMDNPHVTQTQSYYNFNASNGIITGTGSYWFDEIVNEQFTITTNSSIRFKTTIASKVIDTTEIVLTEVTFELGYCNPDRSGYVALVTSLPNHDIAVPLCSFTESVDVEKAYTVTISPTANKLVPAGKRLVLKVTPKATGNSYLRVLHTAGTNKTMVEFQV